MSIKLPNDNSCCAFRPPMPPLGPGRDENRLERFLDKIDANDNGKFSRKELSEAADTDNDGHVSQAEKDTMKDQLNDYIKEAAQEGSWNMKSLGQAQEVMEFLDEKTKPSVRDINGRTHGMGAILEDHRPEKPRDINGRTHGMGAILEDHRPEKPRDINGRTHGMGAILEDHRPEKPRDINGRTHGMGAILEDHPLRNPYMEPHKSKLIDEIGFDPDSPLESWHENQHSKPLPHKDGFGLEDFAKTTIQPVPLPVDKNGKEIPIADLLTPDWQKTSENGLPKK